MKKFSSYLAKLAFVLTALLLLASCFTLLSGGSTQSAEAFYNRGVAYFNNKDYDKAIAEFDAAIRIRPDYAGAFYYRGGSYSMKNDYGRAIADLDAAIAIKPDYAFAFYLRGLVYAMKGDLAAAIADWEEALKNGSELRQSDITAIRQRIDTARQQLGGSAPAAPAQSSQSAAIPAQTSATLYRVGDTGPAGGLIFYDKGNNSNGWRYLEAAPIEAEFQARWSVDTSTRVEGTLETVGSGRRNTQLIVDKFRQTMGEWDNAAQLCDELEFNGFDDWFLPSKNELDQMYGNLKRRNLGDFRNGWYWSSTVAFGYYVNIQNFQDGEMSNSDPRSSRYVRPVRQVPGQ
jgi:hypothetical protein